MLDGAKRPPSPSLQERTATGGCWKTGMFCKVCEYLVDSTVQCSSNGVFRRCITVPSAWTVSQPLSALAQIARKSPSVFIAPIAVFLALACVGVAVTCHSAAQATDDVKVSIFCCQPGQNDIMKYQDVMNCVWGPRGDMCLSAAQPKPSGARAEASRMYHGGTLPCSKSKMMPTLRVYCSLAANPARESLDWPLCTGILLRVHGSQGARGLRSIHSGLARRPLNGCCLYV